MPKRNILLVLMLIGFISLTAGCKANKPDSPSSSGDAYYRSGIEKYNSGQTEQGIEDIRTAREIYQRENRSDRIRLAEETLAQMEKNSPSPSPSLQNCQYTEFVTSMQNRVDAGGLNLFDLYGEVQQGKPLLEQLQQIPECLQTKEILKQTLWKAESQIANIEQQRDAIACGAGPVSNIHSCQDQVLADYNAKLERINEYYRRK